LSCSWYDERTGRALAQEAIDHSSDELRIAFVSTPAAYRDFLKIVKEVAGDDDRKREAMGTNVYLFEYDPRFGDKYGDQFAFYDYNSPTDLPDKFHHFFDYVLMEPPYLVCSCSAERVGCAWSILTFSLTALLSISDLLEPQLHGQVLRHDALAGAGSAQRAWQEGCHCEPVHLHHRYV
jgi:hypothetical protein